MLFIPTISSALKIPGGGLTIGFFAHEHMNISVIVTTNVIKSLLYFMTEPPFQAVEVCTPTLTVNN